MMRSPLRLTCTDTLVAYTTVGRSDVGRGHRRTVRVRPRSGIIGTPGPVTAAARGRGRPVATRLRVTAAPTCEREPTFRAAGKRSDEHTSELQSLMRSAYAVFCL